MAAKPFTEREIEHYKIMVGIIINGDAEKKRDLDNLARLSVAQAKKNMPTADDESLVTFFVSIAFLMAHLMTTQVKNIVEVIESTFDSYTVAAAHIMGAYDVESSEVPTKPESGQTADITAPGASSDDNRNTGLYL